MFFKKQRGATPEPDLNKLKAHQLRRQRRCKLSNTGARVLCNAELPETWYPISNNDRYQMWELRKGATA